MSTSRPRLCFVGPHLGCHPGWVTTQSEVVAELFSQAGYQVRSTSSVRRPLVRSLDMAFSIIRWRRLIDIMVLSVFSGRAFLFAEWISALGKRLGLTQVHFLHGGDLPEMASSDPDRIRGVLGRADAVVAPSPYLQGMSRSLGLDAAVIPNVLQLDDYPFAERRALEPPIRILWMRTFHSIYGPELAVRTLARLIESGIDARLTMAGQDKGLESECRDLAASLRLGDRVIFPGFLRGPAKIEAFSEHDLYLHTNRVDNTPVSLLEAAACGLPVVATRVGGVPDLMGDAGILVEPESPEASAQAVESLIGSSELVERLSRSGRFLAEGCSWPRVHGRWKVLFQELESRRGVS